jgi:hypothetical protein
LKRKIVILLLTALMVFSFAIPALGAHTAGLLRNVTPISGNTSLNPVDGDHATNVYSTTGYTAEWSFDQEKSIDSFVFDATASNWDLTFYLKLPDGTLKRITEVNSSTTRNKSVQTMTAINAIGVVVKNVGGTPDTIYFYEVEVYGSSVDTTPPSVPTGLTPTSGDGSVTLDWTANTETDLAGYNVYQSTDNTTFTKVNTSLITTNSYSVTGLTNDTTYYFTVSAVDTSGNESAQSTSVSATPTAPTTTDTTPPGEVTALSETHTDTTVDLTWTNPTDTDFSHSKVYRDGVLVGDNITTSSFSDSALTAGTDYTYKVTTVDTSGNESTGTSLLVTTTSTTDTIAPEPPTNVEVTPLNTALYVKYDFSVSDDVYGYNVYVDGVKHNTSEIQTNYYNVEGLTNGTSYSIQVSAVDTSGNESTLTLGVNGSPSEDAVPLIKLDFDLTDVATAVGNWFGSIWLILAFSVGIPLSFVVAGRVKGLFST